MELVKEQAKTNGYLRERELPKAPPETHPIKATPEDVRRWWKQVRVGCLEVKHMGEREVRGKLKVKCRRRLGRSGDPGNWTPEHVRAQIELGFKGQSTCELWLITETGGRVKGFVVTVVANCPYTHVPLSLLTWVAYTWEPLNGREARQVLNDLENYGRASGLLYSDGYSNRYEWEAWLRRYGKGYRAALTMLRKNLWE